MDINRSELNKALSKAIAYKQCNLNGEAEKWGRELIKLLELEEILKEGGENE